MLANDDIPDVDLLCDIAIIAALAAACPPNSSKKFSIINTAEFNGC